MACLRIMRLAACAAALLFQLCDMALCAKVAQTQSANAGPLQSRINRRSQVEKPLVVPTIGEDCWGKAGMPDGTLSHSFLITTTPMSKSCIVLAVQ